ncbi:2-phosphosulfolactate phosphatase [Pseudanabaena sp. FACHB-2040]|uniref:2-phosphosulfolactate phosphatase n=1 Tax=Pseudanabaena sp. FACHB-2040 TaxID=2692859 RepID=UPI0016853E9C|nr:2-phosphosulfolactate phosphatase [Pseudanabaena sp. FACHB-2040]MBD2257430.1 2-phosphosulfolactate phosphatase [Pseudanabaena sp. FACHB-2040]
MNFDQADFEVRCEWGKQGVLQLAPISDVVVIIDVLSFSTCIDIANSRGAIVFPYQWRDKSARAFAQCVNAEVAEKRGDSRYSLSPASLLIIDSGTRLVMPSPNGSSLSLATTGTPTLTGCLRNCRAIALAAMNYGQRIAVIPAGEKWDDGSLRPSFEDFIGAGAVISYLEGKLSPEAQLAREAYQSVRQSLKHLIKQCGSGQELIERGFKQDVDLASEMNVSDCVPTLVNGAYANHAR